MKRALVISNGIGAERAFPNREDVCFEVAQVGPDFSVDLAGYDILIAPNGTDHVALYRMRQQIRNFLEAGNSLLCFCGWFLDWVPGNRWIHDNSKPTRDVRHFVGEDQLGLLDEVNLTALDHNRHGISGWWACGFIEPAPGATVLIKDTWDRALVVVDTVTTNGLMILTASGPLGDYSHRGRGTSPLSCLYDNVIRHCANREGANWKGANWEGVNWEGEAPAEPLSAQVTAGASPIQFISHAEDGGVS